MHDEMLFSVLADIVNGYSYCKIDGKDAFVRHLDLSAELRASVTYKKFFDKYRSNGLQTRQERLDFLKQEGDWSDAEDKAISNSQKFLENLLKTKEKLVLKSQLTELEKQIQETRSKLEEKIFSRESLIGAHCEKYANTKKEEDQILHSVFSDESLKKQFLSDLEIEYASQAELQLIFGAYFNIFREFSDDVLKKIAVSAIFYNFFSLTPKDNPALVFGKNILELTFFQQKLLHYAQNARYVYENVQNIPTEIKDNYDALMEFSRKEKTDTSNKGNSGYSIIGAKKNDLKIAGIDTKDSISPFDMLRKSGKKSLNKKDFMNASTSV